MTTILKDDRGVKTREMADRTQNSLIFKAVQKFSLWFPASAKLAAFTTLLQTGSLEDSSLSSRLPIWHFWSSEALNPHTCQFHTSFPLEIWVLCGIQSDLICLNISAFSLQSMCKAGWTTPGVGQSIWFPWRSHSKTAKKLLGCAVLGLIFTY